MHSVAQMSEDVIEVLVAGRSFSATHDPHASGTAAALSAEPKRLPTDTLRARLREDGADVGD